MIYDADFDYEVVTPDDPAFEPALSEKNPGGSDWKGWREAGYSDWRRFLRVKDGEEPLLWKVARLRQYDHERILALVARKADQLFELKSLLDAELEPETQTKLLDALTKKAEVERGSWATPYFECFRASVVGWSGIHLQSGAPLEPRFEQRDDGRRYLELSMASRLADKAFHSVITCGRISLAISDLPERRKN